MANGILRAQQSCSALVLHDESSAGGFILFLGRAADFFLRGRSTQLKNSDKLDART